MSNQPAEPRRCEPRRVNMTPAEYREWYDAQKLAEYESLTNGASIPITGYVITIVEATDLPRPSEVVRKVCAETQAAFRWANFRRVVAEREQAIPVYPDNWLMQVLEVK